MTETGAWSVRGVEPVVRTDALHAAHASGMTLGQWLNGAIRDTLVDMKASRSAAPMGGPQGAYAMHRDETAGSTMHYPQAQPYPYAPGQQPMQQPMQHPMPPHYPPQGFAQPPYAAPGFAQPPFSPPPFAPQPFAPPAFAPPAYPAPYAYAQPFPPQPDPFEQRLRAYAQPQAATSTVPGTDPRIFNVIDAAVRSTETKTAAAIDALTTLMERQRKADEQRVRQPENTSEVARLLSVLTDRLQGLERSVHDAGEARSEAALANARELETRIGAALNALSEAQTQQAAQAAANLARVQERHAQSFAPAAESPADTVTFQAANDSVEPALMQAEAVAVGVRPPPRTHVRPRITVPRASLAVAEIAARQRMLDSGAAPVAEEPDQGGLDTIRRSIAALSEQVRESARLRERKNEQELREEIKDLQRLVQELQPRQIVASVNESIRALASKIEQSREEGLRESQLAPLEALLNEMRSNLLELREPRSLQGVQETLGMLARRIETLGERNADAGQLDEIQRQMADMRAVIADARTDQPFEALKSQIRALSDKLDAAAERPRDTRAMLTLAEAVEEMRRAIRRIDPEAVLEKLETRLSSLDGLEQRIDALSHAISERGPALAPSLDLDRIEKRLEALTQRIDQTGGQGDTAAFGDLSDRIAKMTHALAQRPAKPDLSPILDRIDAVQQAINDRPVAAAAAHSPALEGVLDRLASRIEDMQIPEPGRGLDALQAQIMKLADRIDQASPGTPALGGLEATLHDLCHKVASLETIARQSVGEPGMDLAAEGMVLIKRDLTDMKSAQAQAEARTRDVLGQVNSSLEKIIARLGTIETEASRPRLAPQVSQPVATSPLLAQAVSAPPTLSSAAQLVPTPPQSHASAAVANAGRVAPVLARPPEPVAPAVQRHEPSARQEPREPRHEAPRQEAPRPEAPKPEAAPQRMTAPARPLAGDPDPDLPLEPGGRAPLAGSLAGSDARATFIAAARRAAQVAQEEAALAMAEAEAAGAGNRRYLPSSFEDVKAAVSARRKPLLLGLAAMVVAVGGIKVASQFMDNEPVRAAGQGDTPAVVAMLPAPAQDAAGDKAAAAEPTTTEPVAMASQPPRNIPLDATTAAPAAPAVAAPAGTPVTNPAITPAGPAADDANALMKAMTFVPPEKLKQAALSGNPSAAYEIGARLAEARGGAVRDLKNAARWMEISAKQGLPLAQYRLGSFHREGLGVAKDNTVAFSLFQKAAEQGNALAMHNLAVLHAEGINGAADYGAAAQWFRNAAEHGIKDSQFNIAVLFMQGLGVAPDQVEAYKWFAAAARQGDQEAVKRRDALLARMPADRQDAARQAAENFRAKRPDPRANELVLPEGGWDDKRLPTMAKARSKAV